MSESDAIHKRGHALEDEFFHRVDERLREQLRKKMQREESRRVLAAATGFQDPTMLDQMLDAGIEPETLTALALVPVVFVAWADGSVSDAERETVMNEALKTNLAQQSAAFELVEGWLRNRPPSSMWTLWKEYVSAIRGKMSPVTGDALGKEIHRQATAVAKASGGTLGFGKISSAEQDKLDEIAKVFGSV